MLVFLLGIITFLYGLHLYFQYKAKLSYVKDIPGPKPLPIIGNLLSMLLPPDKMYILNRKWAKQFDGIYKVWVLGDCIINIYNPDDLEVLLHSKKHINKSFVYDILHPWLGTGLITGNPPKWHKNRKILTPSFHFNSLKQFVPIFAEQSAAMIGKLRQENEKEEDTDIMKYLVGVTINTITETAMGTTLDAIGPKAESYKKALYRMGEIFVYLLVRPWYRNPLLFGLSDIGREQKQVLANLHTFTRDVITERKKNFVDVTDIENMEDDFVPKKRMAMLDTLLSANKKGLIDEESMREEVDTFMFAGHDTTLMAITFAIFCLAHNPDIQEKIYEELYQIYGDSDRNLIMEDLQQMPYLEQCIKESLRLFPSAPFVSRSLKEPLELKKHTIPAGMTVHIQILDLHHNPKVWPNPERFDPERFSPDNSVKRHPYAHIPFSAGPRNCIGQKYAMYQEKTVISNIVRNFKIKPVTRLEDIDFIVDIVIRTKNPIKVKLESRNKK